MIIAKQNPVGIDSVIHVIQQTVNAAFDAKWNDGTSEHGIICYPRCYLNFKRRNKSTIYGEQIIEYFDASEVNNSGDYIDTNNDYKDILDGEENKMIILTNYDAFPINATQNYESSFVECIFIVNLNKTHPHIKHRADEEIRVEVKKVLGSIPDVTVHRSIRALNKVFGDIRYSTTLDMHPMHCFKFILSLDRFSAGGSTNGGSSSPGGAGGVGGMFCQ